MGKRFDPDLLARLRAAKVVQIETRAGPRSPVHRTKIWVVVTGGKVYVRSYKGKAGRWYREVRANPETALWIGTERVPMHAVQLRSPEVISKVSAGYRKKYGNSPPAKAMVRNEILGTSLRLERGSVA